MFDLCQSDLNAVRVKFWIQYIKMCDLLHGNLSRVAARSALVFTLFHYRVLRQIRSTFNSFSAKIEHIDRFTDRFTIKWSWVARAVARNCRSYVVNSNAHGAHFTLFGVQWTHRVVKYVSAFFACFTTLKVNLASEWASGASNQSIVTIDYRRNRNYSRSFRPFVSGTGRVSSDQRFGLKLARKKWLTACRWVKIKIGYLILIAS